MLAIPLTALVVVGSLFGLVVSRLRKRDARATIENILLASFCAAVVFFWLLVFIAVPVIGALSAGLSIASIALYIAKSRPTWSEARADYAVAVAFLVLILGVLGVVG